MGEMEPGENVDTNPPPSWGKQRARSPGYIWRASRRNLADPQIARPFANRLRLGKSNLIAPTKIPPTTPKLDGEIIGIADAFPPGGSRPYNIGVGDGGVRAALLISCVLARFFAFGIGCGFYADSISFALKKDWVRSIGRPLRVGMGHLPP